MHVEPIKIHKTDAYIAAIELYFQFVVSERFTHTLEVPLIT